MIQIDSEFVKNLLPTRKEDTHKGESGTVLIIGGCSKYRGAPTLTARGALLSGAGLVAIASVEKAVQVAAAQTPEAIFVVPKVESDALDENLFQPILEFLASKSKAVLAIGPGLGDQSSTSKLLNLLFPKLAHSGVLDADALNFIARGVEPPKGDFVLTPHPGEMERLVGAYSDRANALRACVQKFGKTCLLKGHRTLVSDESGSIYVNSTGNPGMATGGMGDVLTGVIASLIGQGLTPTNAAICGVYLHGLAGDLCLRQSGIGFTASDLAKMLPLARLSVCD